MTWKCWIHHFAEYDNWMRYCGCTPCDYSCLRLTLQGNGAVSSSVKNCCLLSSSPAFWTSWIFFGTAPLSILWCPFLWLHWVWVSAHGIFCWASVRLLSVVADRLRGPSACGILLPWPGIKLASPALEGTFLTTGPPGKSLWCPSISFWEAIRSGVEGCLWHPQVREHTHNKRSFGVLSSPKLVLPSFSPQLLSEDSNDHSTC